MAAPPSTHRATPPWLRPWASRGAGLGSGVDSRPREKTGSQASDANPPAVTMNLEQYPADVMQALVKQGDATQSSDGKCVVFVGAVGDEVRYYVFEESNTQDFASLASSSAVGVPIPDEPVCSGQPPTTSQGWSRVANKSH